ncbi:hypothetical protein EBR03_01710 [bacterium]|nr:hypothetical protein [bacterium]NBX83385.1 hypothetical protein [bacterium]
MIASRIQTLWIGPKLKPIHTASLKSFLNHHHEIHFYCYEPVEGIPDGITVKDASEILPSHQIFSYQQGPGKGSFSAFSNIFRYALLFKKGGIWVDTDIFCLTPWNFDSTPYLFASETLTTESERITASCVIKTPPESPLMKYCWEESLKHSPESLQWGQIGPQLLNRAVHQFGLTSFIRPSWEFCALGWDETELLSNPQHFWQPPRRAMGLHLNHEMLRRASADLNESILRTLEQWK